METKRGFYKRNDLRVPRHHRNTRNRRIALSLLPILLAGCVHWPAIATECETFGVREDDQAMGQMLHIRALHRDELDIHCAAVREATARNYPNAEVRGCVIPQSNGMVAAFYSVGDRCAMYHEICHARHGPNHTERYLRDLANGIPMPYCPNNQLKG